MDDSENLCINSPDTVVDILTRMLCGTQARAFSDDGWAKSGKRCGGPSITGWTANDIYRFDTMAPSRSYTFDATDPDRVFADDHRLLLAPVEDIIGDSAETLVLYESEVRWIGLRKAKGLPKGLCTIGKCRSYYEVHARKILPDGTGTYAMSMEAVSVGGRPVPVLIPGFTFMNSGSNGPVLSLFASVLEDAHRPETVLAEFSDSVSLAMPVALDDYQELFSLRDAPLLPSGRRKAILHWVAKHKRRTKKKVAQVNQHLRGVEQFVVDGLTVKLSPNSRLDPSVTCL